MSNIVMADDGIVFDGNSMSDGPLGGAETAFVSLAEAFVRRGHSVQIYNKCNHSMTKNGVVWKNIEASLPTSSDLYIANRGDRLLRLVPETRSRVFWLHNPASYIKKWRYISKIWITKPTAVFSSEFHARSCPPWVPFGRRIIIPYGISDTFRNKTKNNVPPSAKAIFTSSPLRSLDWLLKIWEQKIWPRVPSAELHIFSSPLTYGSHGRERGQQMNSIIEMARTMSEQGVVIREPLPKDRLAKELQNCRVLLYRGDPGETFCLAVGEAQAVGVPSVVQDIGCLSERVINSVTGFVAKNDEDFSAKACDLLLNDSLWKRQSDAAIELQRGWGWEDAAAAFEKLIVQ